MITKQPEQNEEHTEDKTYFYCYNPKLKNFLNLNGLTWTDRGINKKTEFPYWMFNQTERLSELILKYKIEN